MELSLGVVPTYGEGDSEAERSFWRKVAKVRFRYYTKDELKASRFNKPVYNYSV